MVADARAVHQADGKDLCCVAVQPSPRPVFIRDGTDEHLYIRTGNSTCRLTTKEAIEYAKNHSKVSAKDVLAYGADGALQSVNLDAKNPRGKEDVTHLPPEQLAESILAKEQRIAEIVTKIKGMLGGTP